MSAADRLPFFARAAYRIERHYAFLYGIYRGTLFFLVPVVLKYVLDAGAWHLAIVAAAFPVGMVLAPVWTQVGRRIGMKRLVLAPGLLMGILVCGLAAMSHAAAFTALVGPALLLMAPQVVAQTALYKANYPDTHRNTAVGLLMSLVNLGTTFGLLAAGVLMEFDEQFYRLLFPLVGLVCGLAAWRYSRIHVRPGQEPWRAAHPDDTRLGIRKAARALWRDRRFAVYEVGYAVGGLANFFSFFLVVEVLKEHMAVGTFVAVMLVGIIPVVVQAVAARLWGPLMEKLTPVSSQAIFSSIQMLSFASYLFGSLAGSVWPFYMGSVLRGIAIGGGSINWSTGPLYFAPERQAGTYTGIHIGLTGIRGVIGPLAGAAVFGLVGEWVFGVSTALSGAGVLVMLLLLLSGRTSARTDASSTSLRRA